MLEGVLDGLTPEGVRYRGELFCGRGAEERGKGVFHCGRAEACDTLRDRVALGESVAAHYEEVRYGPCLLKFCKLARNIRTHG